MATHNPEGGELDVPVGTNLEMQEQNENFEKLDGDPPSFGGRLKSLLWHGGSTADAWFSASSNQVAQVLLTLPYSFSQLGTAAGVTLQIFYGLLGCWSCYLITTLYCEYRTRKEKEGHSFKNHVIQWFEVLGGLLGPRWRALGLLFNCTFLLFGSVIQLIACASNIYLINDHLDKRTWALIFGAICMLTTLVPSFHNFRIWSFFGLIMITYTGWYMTIASLVHGQASHVSHSGPTSQITFFTGATNILFTFGGHAVTVEIMHAMYKPAKFKFVYVLATLYVFTVTIPSATVVYWAFGDELLKNSNALALLPRTGWRDVAAVLMLIHQLSNKVAKLHLSSFEFYVDVLLAGSPSRILDLITYLWMQFITFGFASMPLYFVWEKVLGVHNTTNILFRALCRIPVVLPIWFLAIIFPFFGPINSAVGALLVTFTVYIIPCAAHMAVYRSASARTNSVFKLPRILRSWVVVYTINIFIIVWILVVGVGLGGWASITNFAKQVHTFGLFAKCFQCPPAKHLVFAPQPAPMHSNATMLF